MFSAAAILDAVACPVERRRHLAAIALEKGIGTGRMLGVVATGNQVVNQALVFGNDPDSRGNLPRGDVARDENIQFLAERFMVRKVKVTRVGTLDDQLRPEGIGIPPSQILGRLHRAPKNGAGTCGIDDNIGARSEPTAHRVGNGLTDKARVQSPVSGQPDARGLAIHT